MRNMMRKVKAIIAFMMLLLSLVFVMPVQVDPDLPWSITLRLVVDREDKKYGGMDDILSTIQDNLSPIGINVVVEERDGAEFASTVWKYFWDKTSIESNKGWDMTWHRFPRPRSWAVIASTFNEKSFPNDAHYMYHVLTEHYNFENESISYIGADANLPGVDYVATKSNLGWAINQWLASRSDADDLIFIYISGHGGGYNTINNEMEWGRIDGDGGDPIDEDYEHFLDGEWKGVDENIVLKYPGSSREYYWDDELAYDLSTLDYSRLIFVNQACVVGNLSCYSGGFIDDLSEENRIIMTASNETYYSWLDPFGGEDGFSEWSEVFMDALHGEDTLWDGEVFHTGNPVDADSDDDGRVSMLEAWDYAWDNDDARLSGEETPWMDDNGNGIPTYINGTDVLDETDGQLASETYLPAFKDPEKDLDEDLTRHYWANATPPNGGYNIMGWNNTELDELLGSGTQTSNATDKKDDLWKWQEAFMHDPPGIIIYYPSDHMSAKGLAFNLHHPVLSNRYVRQAIAHAIDYEQIHREDVWSNYTIASDRGKGPIHPSTYYTDPDSNVTVHLYNDKLEPYQTNITRALMYMNMWYYAQDDTDYTKGPVGDADFSGKVGLDDFYKWINWFGKRTHQIHYQPGQDVDPDWDNSGFVEMPDFSKWPPRYSFYYPENSTTYSWSRSPVIPKGAEYPFIYVEPASIENTTYEPGTNFTVSIKTDYNGSDITSYEFTLYYNPNVLHGINVTNGNLIVNGTASFIPGTFDNTNGKLTTTGAFFFFASKPAPLTSGPGILANVTFEVVGWGDSGILLGDQTQLVGYTENGWGIDYDIINAWMMSNHIKNSYFTNVHDVAVTSVSYALPYGANATYPSWAINVSTTVKNEGDFTETFNVTVYANSTAIETKNITDLAPGENTTLTITCAVPDPTVWTPYPPYYVVSAEAEAVSWENDTSDNVFVDGSLTVKHPGDVDGDGDVDNTDQQLLMDVFNSEYGDPEYDWRCDFDGDGDIDNNDKAILIDNKGWQA